VLSPSISRRPAEIFVSFRGEIALLVVFQVPVVRGQVEVVVEFQERIAAAFEYVIQKLTSPPSPVFVRRRIKWPSHLISGAITRAPSSVTWENSSFRKFYPFLGARRGNFRRLDSPLNSGIGIRPSSWLPKRTTAESDRFDSSMKLDSNRTSKSAVVPVPCGTTCRLPLFGTTSKVEVSGRTTTRTR
jgi:hypothetical protein